MVRHLETCVFMCDFLSFCYNASPQQGQVWKVCTAFHLPYTPPHPEISVLRLPPTSLFLLSLPAHDPINSVSTHNAVAQFKEKDVPPSPQNKNKNNVCQCYQGLIYYD